MSLPKIRLLGDADLRIRCHPVSDPRSPGARLVALQLRDKLHELRERYGRGRGLAAPQIGAPIRMVYLETDRPWFLINPEITDVGTDDFLVWDDCFSFPDLMVKVQRAHHVRVRYTDERGNTQEIEAEGELAELLQHEIDHLDGVLAVDLATGVDPFCLTSEWDKRVEHEERYSAPFPRDEPPTALPAPAEDVA